MRAADPMSRVNAIRAVLDPPILEGDFRDLEALDDRRQRPYLSAASTSPR